MAGVRDERAEQTRSRVLLAARRLFAEKGYFNAGTTEVVAAAGVGTRGALYHHFADKKALFEAVFEAVEMDLATNAAASITGTVALHQLGQALDAFLDASTEPEVRQILLIDGPAVLGWDRWREIEARFGLGAITRLLVAGIDDGSIEVTDPEAMAHLLLSAIDEAALFIAHATDAGAARAQAGRSVVTLLRGLATRG
jgi:AcrR family transcriptional regulator